MNYLVIDLEMCKVPKHYRSNRYKYANEIIQVGAVLLEEKYEIIKPILDFELTSGEVTRRTGINNGMLSIWVRKYKKDGKQYPKQPKPISGGRN